MIAFLLYTLKVSLCLVVFYLFYILLLRHSTFFKLNRFYLLSVLILSFLIPILKLSIFKGQPFLSLSTYIDFDLVEPDSGIFKTQNSQNEIIPGNFQMILPLLYLSGVSIMFFRLLLSILRVVRIQNKSEFIRLGKIKIRKTLSHVPFSFFDTVFLPQCEGNPMIINHEIAHIRQFHWFDLLISEIVSVLIWYNPFVFLFKRAIKLQHEYLADNQVIGNLCNIEGYLGCMLNQVQVASSVGLESHFYCKTIKKRINMITKNKTSVKYLGVYLLIVPVMCLLLYAFRSEQHIALHTVTKTVDTIKDANIPSIYPVDKEKVTNTNGYGIRIHPMHSDLKQMHAAIDFALPEGENVYSTATGIVIKADFEEGHGNCILIKHSDTYSTFYSHLKSISVKSDQLIERGQIIGFVGNTGLSTGPHLHYEVIKDGERVNPADYLP